MSAQEGPAKRECNGTCPPGTCPAQNLLEAHPYENDPHRRKIPGISHKDTRRFIAREEKKIKILQSKLSSNKIPEPPKSEIGDVPKSTSAIAGSGSSKISPPNSSASDYTPGAEETQCSSKLNNGYLPLEILSEIFNYAYSSLLGPPIDHSFPKHTPLASKYHTQIDSDPEEVSDLICTLCPQLNLCNWALVCRYWHFVVSPMLYSNLDLRTLTIPGLSVARPVPVPRPLPLGQALYVHQISDNDERDILWAQPEVGQRMLLQNPPRVRGQRSYEYVATTVRRATEETVPVQYRRIPGDGCRGGNRRDMRTLAEDSYLLEFEYLKLFREYPRAVERAWRKLTLPNWHVHKGFAPAPIKRPLGCSSPDRNHHNYFHEWSGTHLERHEYHLTGVSQWNPLSEYLLNRVLIPLLKTLQKRPDLADHVRKINLPLLLCSTFEMTHLLIPSYYKFTEAGFVVEVDEDDTTAEPGNIYSLIIETALQIMKLCRNLEGIEGPWPLQLGYLLQEIYFEHGTVSRPDLIMTPARPKSILGSTKLFDLAHRAQAHRGIEPFSGYLADACSNEERKRNERHRSIQKQIATTWLEFVETQLPKLISWTVDLKPVSATAPAKHCRYRSTSYYLGYFSRALCSCTVFPNTNIWLQHVKRTTYTKLQRRSDSALAKALGICSAAKPDLPQMGQNLVHLELSFTGKEKYHYGCSYLLNDIKRCLSAVFGPEEKGLPNLESLSLMQDYVSVLDSVPANKLKCLKIREWDNLEPVVSYLRRSFKKSRESTKQAAALKSLTIDAVCYSLASATFLSMWNDVSASKADKYALTRSILYKILRYAPGLQELVVRRGRFFCDPYWKVRLTDCYLDWNNPNEPEPPSDLSMNEPWPPVAKNLISFACLAWGRSIRLWIYNMMSEHGSLPILRYLEYATAEADIRRRAFFRGFHTREKCLEAGGSGTFNCVFCGWERDMDISEQLITAKLDDLMMEDVGKLRGIKVLKHRGLEAFPLDFVPHP